jgi:hypothetical protein
MVTCNCDYLMLQKVVLGLLYMSLYFVGFWTPVTHGLSYERTGLMKNDGYSFHPDISTFLVFILPVMCIHLSGHFRACVSERRLMSEKSAIKVGFMGSGAMAQVGKPGFA